MNILQNEEKNFSRLFRPDARFNGQLILSSSLQYKIHSILQDKILKKTGASRYPTCEYCSKFGI